MFTSAEALCRHLRLPSIFPPPSDKPALQRFLGMLNIYRKFLRRAVGVLAPLTDALRGPDKSLVSGSGLCLCRAKDLLADVPELVHPRPGAQISLAFDSHLGSILQQLLDGSWASLATFSKKLSATECKYCFQLGATCPLLFSRELQIPPIRNTNL